MTYFATPRPESYSDCSRLRSLSSIWLYCERYSILLTCGISTLFIVFGDAECSGFRTRVGLLSSFYCLFTKFLLVKFGGKITSSRA